MVSRIGAFIDSRLAGRNQSPAQAAYWAAFIEQRFAAEAKERQRKHGGTAPGKKADTPGNVSGSDDGKGDARDLAGQKHNVSGRTVSKAKNVINSGCNQLKQALRDDRLDACAEFATFPFRHKLDQQDERLGDLFASEQITRVW